MISLEKEQLKEIETTQMEKKTYYQYLWGQEKIYQLSKLLQMNMIDSISKKNSTGSLLGKADEIYQKVKLIEKPGIDD